MTEQVILLHLHRSVDKRAHDRARHKWEYRCYWSIWKEDGTEDGRFVADVMTSYDDALAMAEGLGDIVTDDHYDVLSTTCKGGRQ